LFAIVVGVRRCEALVDKVGGMRQDHVEPFALEISALTPVEPEPPAERRLLKALEKIVKFGHDEVVPCSLSSDWLSRASIVHYRR
jgi:hypothetical protein